MPYTPPAQRSPCSSPPLSRRSSHQAGLSLGPPPPNGRPALPRSASYLTRHRRTPSVKSCSPPSEPPSPMTMASPKRGGLKSSLRRSPPPITNDLMPPQAVISPPDSGHNSSDDETTTKSKRERHFEDLARITTALNNLETPTVDGAKGHRRAQTESVFDLTSSHTSDDDSDNEPKAKPPMVRKKSGELVRPALRLSHRRPSSMPGTPTFAKNVHFDAHLEHVRHFLQVDRPLAVSAGSSPVDNHESDGDFPFDEEPHRHLEPPFEWEIVLANLPADTPERLAQPVRVERVFLSSDNKTLVGTVAVANISFQKLVVARFTLDYWRTTSEVTAEYNNDIRRRHHDGYDRFNFNIRLSDLANLEAKTMFFCVKYSVNGTDIWDNNNRMNYQVDFKKKFKPQNGKKGPQPASSRPAAGLPRSHRRTEAERPKSLPTMDDFSQGFDSFDFGKKPKLAAEDLLGESTVRLKGSQSAISLPSHRRQQSGSQFSNRYDFGASLSAAIQAANAVLGDRSGLPPRKTATHGVQTDTPVSSPRMGAKPTGDDSPRVGTEKPPMSSQSYNELLDKYCFFGSNKSSPTMKDGSLTRSAQYDGAPDARPPTSPHPTSPLKNATPSSTRSTSPAPMTGFAANTPPMYHYHNHSAFPFNEGPAATAIRG